jgi:hypothetical protein
MEMAFQWETLEEDIPTLFNDLLQSAQTPLRALQSEIRGTLVFVFYGKIADILAKINALALCSLKELTSEFEVWHTDAV